MNYVSVCVFLYFVDTMQKGKLEFRNSLSLCSILLSSNSSIRPRSLFLALLHPDRTLLIITSTDNIELGPQI